MSKYPKIKENRITELYECYGHFYTLKLDKNIKIKCRSVLEIVQKPFRNDPKLLSLATPNAIVIMMNPGKSEPNLTLINNYQEEKIPFNNFMINFRIKRLDPTKPDPTTKKIIKVMNVLKWKHVRILNLSDIREEKSPFLKNHLSHFGDSSSIIHHSIFSDIRLEERKNAFCWNIENIPVIVGWGAQECLSKISRYAENEIRNHTTNFFGIHNHDSFYLHPGRAQNWHDNIINQIIA